MYYQLVQQAWLSWLRRLSREHEVSGSNPKKVNFENSTRKNWQTLSGGLPLLLVIDQYPDYPGTPRLHRKRESRGVREYLGSLDYSLTLLVYTYTLIVLLVYTIYMV